MGELHPKDLLELAWCGGVYGLSLRLALVPPFKRGLCGTAGTMKIYIDFRKEISGHRRTKV